MTAALRIEVTQKELPEPPESAQRERLAAAIEAHEGAAAEPLGRSVERELDAKDARQSTAPVGVVRGDGDVAAAGRAERRARQAEIAGRSEPRQLGALRLGGAVREPHLHVAEPRLEQADVVLPDDRDD